MIFESGIFRNTKKVAIHTEEYPAHACAGRKKWIAVYSALLFLIFSVSGLLCMAAKPAHVPHVVEEAGNDSKNLHRQSISTATDNPFLTGSLHDCAEYLNSNPYYQTAVYFVELMALNMDRADSIVVCWPGDFVSYTSTLDNLFSAIVSGYSFKKIEELVAHADTLFPLLRIQKTPTTIFDVCWLFLQNSDHYKNCNLPFTVLFALYSKNYPDPDGLVSGVSDALKSDTAFARQVLQLLPKMFQYFSPVIRATRDFALPVVSKYGELLQFASDDLKDDSLLVLAAVRNRGLALQFASTRLRGDRAIVEAAVQQDGTALQYAIGFSADVDVCIEALLNNAHAIAYISQSLLSDTAFVRLAIVKQPLALLAFPDSIKNNREFMLLAASEDGEILEYLYPYPYHCDDKEIAIAAVRSDSYSLVFLSDRLRDDKEVLLAALEFASPTASTQDFRGVAKLISKSLKDLLDQTMNLLGLSTYFSREVLLNRYRLCSTVLRTTLDNLWDNLLAKQDAGVEQPICIAVYAGDPAFPYYDHYLHLVSKYYCLYFYNARTEDDFTSAMLEATQNKSRQADALMIGGHGMYNLIRFGSEGSSVDLDEKRYLDMSDSSLGASLRGCMKRGGIVIHHACSNAEQSHSGSGMPGNLQEFAHSAFWPEVFSYAAEFSFLRMDLEFRNGTISNVSFDGNPAVIMLPDNLSEIADASFAPRERMLLANYPNPFTGSTTFRFEVSRETSVTAVIGDVLGRRARTFLRSESKTPGTYFLQWDGNNDEGKPLPGGLYFFELTGGFHTQSLILSKIR